MLSLRGCYVYKLIRQFFLFSSRSTGTILGDTGDDQELFLVDDCELMMLDCVVRKVEVSNITFFSNNVACNVKCIV